MSYLAADQFFPEWNVWTRFLEESPIGFKLDALAGSHPIEVTENFVTLQCYDHICALWEFTDVYITFLVNLDVRCIDVSVDSFPNFTSPKNKYDMIGFTFIYLVAKHRWIAQLRLKLGLGIHASQFMFYECFELFYFLVWWYLQAY